MNRFSSHGVALVLLAVIFVSLNLFATVSFRAARLDLTQHSLFTLSEGTHSVL